VAHKSKHSEQNALIVENRESVIDSAESKIKRKRSKSDMDKEKRENDKLLWRDDHCENPSAT
jgi:hypothetical protein